MRENEIAKRLQSHGVTAAVTKVRHHTNPDGSPVVLIDRVRASEEQLATMIPAVAAFMGGLKVTEGGETIVRGKAKWTSHDVPAQPKDLLAATLILHEETGDQKGDPLPAPYVSVTTAEGTKHRIDFNGRALRVCKFCDGSREALLMAPNKRSHYHKACLNAEIVKLQTPKLQTPAARLLA